MEQFERVFVAGHEKREKERREREREEKKKDFYLSPDNPCLTNSDEYLSGAFWNILCVFLNYTLNCVERTYEPL